MAKKRRSNCYMNAGRGKEKLGREYGEKEAKFVRLTQNLSQILCFFSTIQPSIIQTANLLSAKIIKMCRYTYGEKPLNLVNICHVSSCCAPSLFRNY